MWVATNQGQNFGVNSNFSNFYQKSIFNTFFHPMDFSQKFYSTNANFHPENACYPMGRKKCKNSFGAKIRKKLTYTYILSLATGARFVFFASLSKNQDSEISKWDKTVACVTRLSKDNNDIGQIQFHH